MVDLDNVLTYQKLDTSGMLNHLHEFPEQCQRASQKVSSFDLPQEYTGLRKVIILGVGGWAIAGEMVRGLALAESKGLIWIHRDYDLPLFVDEDTLVIVSSYSGNTEETLYGFTESLKTPAKKLVLTTGGRLRELAEKEGVPTVIIDYQAPPRAAFPYIFVTLLGIFQKIGWLEDKSANLREMIQFLNKLSRDFIETTPLASNPAKQLATKLWGHIIIIYGAGTLSPVAQRWKTQFNENSKTLAFFELFPELNHNAVVGYELPSTAKERIFVVLLHSPLLHPRIQLHYEGTAKLLDKSRISHEFVEAAGETSLTQLMSLVLFGDYLSFYLAILNRIDPTPIDSIYFIKRYLAQFPTSTSQKSKQY